MKRDEKNTEHHSVKSGAHQRHATCQVLWCQQTGHRSGHRPLKGLRRGNHIHGARLSLSKGKDIQKYIHVEHGREQMEEELNTIVDNGGYIVNTGIDHPTYGKIHVDMNISSRKDVKAFIQKSYQNDFSPSQHSPPGSTSIWWKHSAWKICWQSKVPWRNWGFSESRF